MAMQFKEQYPLNPDQLYAIYTDLSFYKKRYAETEVDKYDIEQFQQRHDGYDIHIEINPPIHMPAGVPSSAKKLVPDRQQIKYSAVWHISKNGDYTADYCYDVQGRPIKVIGKRVLTANAEGTFNQVDFYVECKIPVFGKILAGLIEDRVRLELSADEAAIKEFIAQ